MIHKCMVQNVQLNVASSTSIGVNVSLIFNETLNGQYKILTRMLYNDNYDYTLSETYTINGNSFTYLLNTFSNLQSGKIIVISAIVGDTLTDVENADKNTLPTYYLYYFSEPTLTLNLIDGQVISTSGYNFILNYSQENNEPIDYCTFNIYDSNLNLIKSSPKLFNANTPPLIFSYYFKGFENNHTYYINVKVKTLYGTEVETGNMAFSIDYDEPILYGGLKFENNCDKGCVEVISDISPKEGTSNPNPMVYIDEGSKYSAYAIKPNPIIAYGSTTSGWICWRKNIDIKNNFVLKFWFNVGTKNNNIIRLYNSNGNYLNVKFNRLRRNEADLNGDYVEVSTSEGVIANSNIITSHRANPTTRYFLWIKVVGDSWDVRLSEVSRQNTVFNWEDSNNTIDWNMTSDLRLLGEQYENADYSANGYSEIPNSFDTVLIGNAICRQLLITNDISLDYSDVFNEYDKYTVLRCIFNQNLRGGTIVQDLTNISAIKVKRKDSSNNLWIELYEQPITSEEDLDFEWLDYGVPAGMEETYAFVPLLENGDEGEYLTDTHTVYWNACYIYDGIQSFKLYSSVNYGNANKNKPIGVLNPIGSIYPIVIENSDNNYLSGQFSAQVLGYNFENTRHIDRADVVKQTQDLCNFLTNGRSKLITDWNGNSWLVKVISSPSISYNMATTNGTNTVTFSWVEQGKYNNEEDLKEHGFIGRE